MPCLKLRTVPHILVRHEQAATHAADGYARATGKTGVVLVTSGPGATNAITGIATAYMDSIPMVVLAGQVQSHLIGEDAFPGDRHGGYFPPHREAQLHGAAHGRHPSIIKKAFYIASTGRPGPVVVDIPKDLTHPEHKFEYYLPGVGEPALLPAIAQRTSRAKFARQHVYCWVPSVR